MADDLPLLDWLRERIWPLEGAHDEKSLRASADLGLVELLRGGTTSILDMGTVHHHDVVFEAMRDAGIRGTSGKAMMDSGVGVARSLRETTRESLRESEALSKRWHGAEGGRLRYGFAPRFILSCTEALFRSVGAIARERAMIVHTHAAEHPGERKAVRKIFGRDDVDMLASWGIRGPHVVLAHGVQVTAKECKAIAAAGTRIVHCPSANLKLGSGVANVVAMRSLGIVVGIGADGAPCNNNLDAFVEMRHASLLAKRLGDPTVLSSHEVLRMATIDGAKALGIDGEVGSLEVGKRADVAVVEIQGAHVEPAGDAAGRIVYAAHSRDVRHVIVDGRIVVRDRELTTMDESEVLSRARREARRVASRAGIA
jgi:cytosine/adenosine deaminase-related metal-dependent hydrolase